MKQRIVMFDFDGVIADSFDVFYQALVRALREFGYGCVRNPAEFRALCDGNFYRSLRGKHIGREDLDEILAEVGRRVQGRMDDMRLFPGVREAVADLSQSCLLYIITSNQSSAVDAYLKKAGMRSRFRAVLGVDVHPSKIQKIQRVRRLHPRQSFVYVGDTVGDMREARGARVAGAAVSWGWHDAERLQQEKPAFLLRTPADLATLRLGA